MNRYYDLSQRIEEGMTIFPGDPVPRFEPAAGAISPWRVTALHLGSHSGTHIDAPSHFLPDGKTIDQYPLERFMVAGIILPFTGLSDDQSIQADFIQKGLKGVPKGGAVLIRTGWDQFWNTDRYLRHPYLSPEAAEQIAEAGPGLVGIDALNVDSTVQGTNHAHRILLGNDILIVENLTRLEQLQPGVLFQFSFLPIFSAGWDGSPVRAAAWKPTLS